MDLNKAQIIGRLTIDPELRSTPSGVQICDLKIATNFTYTDQTSGQKVDQVEYHTAVCWRKLAEIAGKHLKKGDRVYVEGRIQTRSWDKEDKKHFKTEIVVDNLIMLNEKHPRLDTADTNNGTSSGNPTTPTNQQLD